MQGWIKLHRKVKSHWLFTEKRTFTKFEAWIDLLLEVNHKDNKFMLGNELVEVKRGQTITSIRLLCERWNWSNTKVTKFLKMLETDEMLTVKSDTKKTVITIGNYDIYQVQETEETTVKRHDNDSEATQKHTNKNDKNVKNEKEKIPYKEIILYLNEKAGTKYKHSAQGNQKHISARWNDGYRLDDFKKVIDYCCTEWKGKIFANGQKGDDYLQPSTLFNGKFDERLNKTPKQEEKKLSIVSKIDPVILNYYKRLDEITDEMEKVESMEELKQLEQERDRLTREVHKVG